MSAQVNIRLDETTNDRLDALAFVRRETVGAVARLAIQGYLAAHADEPGLEHALRARAVHDRAAAPPVTPMSKRGSRRS